MAKIDFEVRYLFKIVDHDGTCITELEFDSLESAFKHVANKYGTLISYICYSEHECLYLMKKIFVEYKVVLSLEEESY